jgi:putative ABC transport system permease protein
VGGSGRFRRAFRLQRRSEEGAEASVDEELAFHLGEITEELVRAGWDPAAARAEALRRFGDVEQTRAYCARMQTRREREGRTAMWIEELRQDIRYALRTLRGAPGYALIVIATLAFGIAANTTIFSVMNPYLLRPLPYGEPEELVQVNQVNPITGWDMDRFSYPQYEDWKERTRAFRDLAAYSYGSANVTGAEGPEQISYTHVTASLFGVLRVEPFLGRSFLPEEGGPGGERVVIMAEGLWRRRYGADPDIVGRPITMDGVQHTVVGIMPARFNFPFGSAKLWVPIRDDAAASRAHNPYQLVGRLADGWTAERARAELTSIQTELGALHPDSDGRMSGVTVKPLREALNFAWDVLSISFRVLLGAVGCVLMLACVNVAGLTLARGTGRRREIAVRVSLGAARRRVVRQLMTESLALATLGGLLGVALAALAVRGLGPLLPDDLYRSGDIAVDTTVLLFSATVTLLTAIAFGVAPALTASRVDLTTSLKDGSRGSGAAAPSRIRGALVVAQVALAVVLITGAGLMLRSLAGASRMELGFDPDRVVVTEVRLPADEYPTAAERIAFVERSVTSLAGAPGVVSASAATWLPLNHETFTLQVAPSGDAGTPGDEWPLAVLNDVYSGYFAALDIELQGGRDFSSQDGPEARRVVIVNRTLADRFWPAGQAVGQTLLAGDDPRDPIEYAVIGVVEDVRHSEIASTDVGPQIYRPARQGRRLRYFLLARTSVDPSQAVPSVRATMREIEPDLPADVRPMSHVVRENLLQWSLSGGFLAVFGVGALLLAALGIYGLVAFGVSQRTRELAVRIALGASRQRIRREVVADGLRPTAIGLLVGMVAALGLGRLAASMLYGISPWDPTTLATVVTLFLAIAALASFVPARRASRTDPMGALRAE